MPTTQLKTTGTTSHRNGVNKKRKLDEVANNQSMQLEQKNSTPKTYKVAPSAQKSSADKTEKKSAKVKIPAKK